MHICKVLLILRAQNVYRNGGFMGEQLIISISREYGSGGHEIALAMQIKKTLVEKGIIVDLK